MEHQHNAMLFTVKRKRGIKPKRENRKIILLSESSQHDKAWRPIATVSKELRPASNRVMHPPALVEP